MKKILLIACLSFFGTLTNATETSVQGFAQQGIDHQFDTADVVIDKVTDIKAAVLNYYSQNSIWPVNLADVVTDGFYVGTFLTPYSGSINGADNGNTYTLIFTASSATIATYIANKTNATAVDSQVTLTLGLPSQMAAISTTLSRIYDASGTLNTMQTNILMGGNNIIDVGNVGATTLNASAGVFDSGVRVYSSLNKPTAAELSVVPNSRTVNGKALNADITLAAADVGAVPITRTVNGHALSANITVTKSDVGLSNVSNFAISNSYNVDNASQYASSKAVRDAYQALNTAKLDKTGKAADTDLFDGLESSLFVQVSRTINGKALSSNINLTAADVGAAPSGEYLVKGADIPGSVDLNNYLTTGLYHQNSNSSAASGANYPIGLAGNLEVVSDGSLVYQTYHVYNGGGKYQRTKYINTWYAWNKIYDSGNKPTATELGVGSISSANTWNGANTFNGHTGFSSSKDNIFYVPSSQTIEGASDNNNGLSVYQTGGTGDAFMTFHIGGDYALRFGLDGSTNRLAVGGWSLGANSYALYHEGFKGSGSGLDADLLDGYNADVNATANTVPVRSGSGDISARLFRSEYDTTNGTIGYIMTQVDTASDNYIRPSTPAQFRTAVTDAYYVPVSRTINGKSLNANVTLSAADIGIGDRTTWNSSASSYNSVVGQLAWRNYGNNHSIFDASASLSPSGTAIDNNTPSVGWSSSYPTLMGWNGANTYGVRVDVASKLYYGTAKKAEANSTGLSITGTSYSTDWQTEYMDAFHTGNSFYMRPYDDGAWQSGREFGYDSGNNRWFVEGNFNVTGNLIANDVTAGGTSMSAIKSFMDSGGGASVVETLYESVDKQTTAALSKSMVVGGVYYIETSGRSNSSACDTGYSWHLKNTQFIVFKYTGVGQTSLVRAVCGSYEVSETMTAVSANNLSLTFGSGSWDVGFRKVIRIK